MIGIKDLAQRLLSGREGKKTENEQTNGEEYKMTRTTLNVEGMSCGHCKATVEGELDKLTGVEHSDADFENNTVEVSYDERRVTTDALRGAVEKAGYTVSG